MKPSLRGLRRSLAVGPSSFVLRPSSSSSFIVHHWSFVFRPSSFVFFIVHRSSLVLRLSSFVLRLLHRSSFIVAKVTLHRRADAGDRRVVAEQQRQRDLLLIAQAAV